jgi:hypothetical protein
MQSLSGYSVYDGWQVQGWPRFVVRRGQLVLADGEITARPGDGEWLRRNGTAGMLPVGPARPARSPRIVALSPVRSYDRRGAKNEWDQPGHASYDRSHAEL